MNASPTTPVSLGEDRTVTVLMNKVEIGQGIRTAIAQIAAEELDVSMDRVVVRSADTDTHFDGASTTGSNSIQGLGSAVRQAAADIRNHLVTRAAAEWDDFPENLSVEDGIIRSMSGETADYWELWPSKDGTRIEWGSGVPKRPEEYQVVGQSIPRSDLPLKFSTGGNYVQDMSPKGMLHGRVVRPPSYGAKLLTVNPDVGSDSRLHLVRDGSFLGVIAEDEEEAVQIAARLADHSTWEETTELPVQRTLYDHLLSQPDQPLLVVDGKPCDDPIPPIAEPDDSAHTLKATYKRPYQMHGALSPSSAMALWDGDDLTVWSHSQGVFSLQGALGVALGIPTDRVRVLHARRIWLLRA